MSSSVINETSSEFNYNIAHGNNSSTTVYMRGVKCTTILIKKKMKNLQKLYYSVYK